MKSRRWSVVARVAVPLLALGLLTGCDGFFVPLTTTTTTGGGGGGTGPNLVYTANAATNTIAGFGLSTGAFVEVPKSPYSLNFTPAALAVTPDNRFLYVGGNGAILLFAINSDGSLTAQNNGAALNQVSAQSMDISPDGQFLYVLDQFVRTDQTSTGTNYVGAVDIIGITKSSGALSLPVVTPFSIANVVVVPKAIRVTPAGTKLYAAVGTAGVVGFSVNLSNGALGAPLFTTPNSISSDNGLTIDSTSSLMYVAQSGTANGVMGFSIRADGTLGVIQGSPFVTGLGPNGLTLDANNKFLYVANSLEKNTANITGYSVGTGGSLTALATSPYQSGGAVSTLGRDARGKYILAASPGGGPDLVAFSVNPLSPGSLTSAATVSPNVTGGPVAIATTH